MGFGTQSKLWLHTTVTVSNAKSFDTHFVSSGLLQPYLVIQLQLSLYQPIQLFFAVVFFVEFNGNLQEQVVLEKGHRQMLRGRLQQTLKKETLK